MFLHTLMNNLASVELRQVYLNDNGMLAVDESHRREMVALIKTTLTELHTRLPIRVGVLKIAVIPGTRTYKIVPEHCESVVSNHVKYILDSEDPYKNDLLKVFRVTVPCEGGYVDALDNSLNDKRSFAFTSFNEIRIPADYAEDHFIVEYQADIEPFNMNEAITSPQTIWLNVPPSLETAIRLGVASKKLGTIGFAGAPKEGDNYLSRYINEIDRLVFQNNLLSATDYSDNSFRSRGWV